MQAGALHKLEGTLETAAQDDRLRADVGGAAPGGGGLRRENEISTMPGFTSTSMYPKMWAQSGIEHRDLLTTLLDTAIARGSGLR